jgi:hypothetical protein
MIKQARNRAGSLERRLFVREARGQGGSNFDAARSPRPSALHHLPSTLLCSYTSPLICASSGAALQAHVRGRL